MAKGVVTSEEDADVTSGGPGNTGGDVAIGVLCRDSCLGISVVAAAAPARLGVGGSDTFSLEKRGECWALFVPCFRDGVDLLLCTPLPPGVIGLLTPGVTGVGPNSERLLCLLDTDTFRRKLDHLLSAPMLAPELLRPMIVLDRPTGVVGVDGDLPGEGTPDCTSFTVSSFAAVPGIPMRKLSWFSMRKIKTS